MTARSGLPQWGVRARSWFGVLGVPVAIIGALGALELVPPVDRTVGGLLVSALLVAWVASGLAWLVAEVRAGFGEPS